MSVWNTDWNGDGLTEGLSVDGISTSAHWNCTKQFPSILPNSNLKFITEYDFFFPVIHHPRLIFLRLCLPFLFVCLGVNDGFWLAFQNVNSILYFMQFPPICFAAHFLFYVKSVVCFFSTHLNNWMDILRDWWFNFPGAVYWLLITFLLHNTSTVFTMIHVFKKNIEWFYYIQIIFFHWSRITNLKYLSASVSHYSKHKKRLSVFITNKWSLTNHLLCY